jgi:hypothetical protein
LRRFGDAHQEFVRVNLDPDEEYIFQIYERINDMDKPFFIMTSVHSLPKDEVNPVVFSEIYRSEIKSNYDNAVIMCDEIRMRPLSNFSIEAKVPRLTCDGFLVHSGNFLFRGPELVSGLEAVDDLKNYEYVLQLLLLKLQTGYLRIKEVAS